ncbi:MAG TPA: hypothetical protein VG939_05005 [Caulobacteraceae bacterium]|nr:hypothetical protein [Caulobacteraceae bacterium]
MTAYPDPQPPPIDQALADAPSWHADPGPAPAPAVEPGGPPATAQSASAHGPWRFHLGPLSYDSGRGSRDKLAMIGATLSDIASGLRGETGDAVATQRWLEAQDVSARSAASSADGDRDSFENLDRTAHRFLRGLPRLG